MYDAIMENSQVVVMYASYRHWILEGIVRDSAIAIGLKIRIIWIPVNFREFFAWSVITSFKNFLYFWKPVLIVNQKMYTTIINFRATKLWLKLSKRVRIYFTHETNLENLRIELETTNFAKRIIYSYYLRDFNLASIELVAGIFLFSFGFLLGIIS